MLIPFLPSLSWGGNSGRRQGVMFVFWVMSFQPRTDLCLNPGAKLSPGISLLLSFWESPSPLPSVGSCLPWVQTTSFFLLSCFLVLSAYILAKNGCMLDIFFNFSMSQSVLVLYSHSIDYLALYRILGGLFRVLRLLLYCFLASNVGLRNVKLFWFPKVSVFWNFMMTCLGESLLYPLGWELSGLFWCGNFILPFWNILWAYWNILHPSVLSVSLSQNPFRHTLDVVVQSSNFLIKGRFSLCFLFCFRKTFSVSASNFSIDFFISTLMHLIFLELFLVLQMMCSLVVVSYSFLNRCIVFCNLSR